MFAFLWWEALPDTSESQAGVCMLHGELSASFMGHRDSWGPGGGMAQTIGGPSGLPNRKKAKHPPKKPDPDTWQITASNTGPQ